LLTLPPAQPVSNALTLTSATQATRAVFFLRSLIELSMVVSLSARGAVVFERIFR
jgi:hypothetical protein